MAKFYAVKGEENLIFTSWDDCKFFLDGKKGYKYKSFSTEQEAKAFLEDRDYYGELISDDLKEGYAVAFTDGSYEETVGKYSYGVIAVSPDGKESNFSGRGEKTGFLSSRNVAGEVEGVLCALNWAFLNGFTKLKIYHDYEGLATWYDGRWNCSSPISYYYVSKISKYKGVLDVTFQKVKGHSNNKYNDLVDRLAKDALFEGKINTLEGVGYKISGKYFFEDFISWFNKKAPKAKVDLSEGKATFTLNGSYLSVYEGLTACAIVGDNYHLHALSTVYFLENHNDVGVNRLIERFFETYIEKEEAVDRFETFEISMRFYGENKAPSLIFILEEIEEFIKKSLDVKDKISPYFEKADGKFRCKVDTNKKQSLEELYSFFFEKRVEFFNLNLTEDKVIEIANTAKRLLKEAE